MTIEEIEDNGCVSAPLLATIQGTECVVRIAISGNDQQALDGLDTIVANVKATLGGI